MNDEEAIPAEEIKIRAMRQDDLEQVIQIEHEIFLFPWSYGNFSDSIRTGYHCFVLVPLDNRTIMGYGVLMSGPDEGHVLTLGVGTSWQNQGLGKKMLQFLIEFARKQALHTVLLDVRESNTGAIKFYQRLGFQQIAVRKDYYPTMCGHENALIMTLTL